MSKIEEALKKVRGTNLVVHRSPAREESPRALAPVPSTEPVSLAQRVNSREEIGRMNSPWSEIFRERTCRQQDNISGDEGWRGGQCFS